MQIAVAMLVKLISAMKPRRKPSAAVAERAFERAVAQFHAQ